MSLESKIQFSHISKSFDNVHALKDVSLEIKKSDIYGIIGMSGAGKSTLIRLINGLTCYSQGSLKVNGIELKTLSNHALRQVRTKIGMIFQHFNLLEQKTVLHNVLLPLKLIKMPHQLALEKAKHMLQLVDLLDKLNAYPSQLSGGQKQRVAIARALVNDPDILLCDEPTSALDPISTQNILDLIKRLHDQLDLTVVIITHEMKVIEQVCSKVAILDQGEVVEEGIVKDIFVNPQSQAAKKLLFVQEVEIDNTSQKVPMRLVFDGQNAFEPLISQLVLNTSQPINILWANTKEISGKVYGQMLIQVVNTPQVIAKIESVLEKLNIYYSIEKGVQA